MFWHETKGLVHEFTHNSHFRTLEDLLLGNVVDNLIWCGKESSSSKTPLFKGIQKEISFQYICSTLSAQHDFS